ncbi:MULTISPECIES: aminotransferase [unclassified Leucobacter]|uniref:aminotransferase n=1 Tax=unclassified Leucobacter TaxID=2621730 RepID=UPI000622B220|nr:aminotransferase [Leucobacter sp. Ag1]KKI17000.1 aminotransferase class-III [Leucobacter sp. Ag1]
MGDALREDWLLRRPEPDLAEVARIAEAEFGATGTLGELGSQQDRNFLIGDPAGDASILLKVVHPTVTEAEVSLQVRVSDALREAGVRTPRILTAASGQRSLAIADREGGESRVLAYETVRGVALAERHEIDGARAEELGSLAARVANALASVDHPAARRRHQWELGNAAAVVERLIGELPEERRDACRRAVDEALQRLDAVRPLLRAQLIHGDLTSDNIMLDAAGALWVIDLGDAARSWRIAELAVLVADVLGRTGSLATAARAVSGFAATCEDPLTDAELAALWPLVTLRGAVLAVSGWSQIRIDPDNAYARERLEHEWRVFERAAALDPDPVEAQLRLAAGLTHRAGLAYRDLVPGLDRARVIDLGIRSEALDRGRWTDAGVEQELARAALGTASVAVMRFGEARLSRVSTDVREPVDTRSRCVELWTRPGATVTAPFAGRIETGAGFAELRADGVVLRIEGIDPAVSPSSGEVRAGAELGRVGAYAPGLGRLVVARRMLDAAPAPLFAGALDEYAPEGAADPSALLGLVAVPDPTRELRDEQRRREHAMGGAAERYYLDPPRFERGWNTLLIDTRGRAYLDLVNNVTAIGHSHPRLADAVGRQLHLLNTNSRFLYEAYADFAEKLLAHAPDPSLDTVIPVNSGSEAVDLAIRLAQAATGRRDLIAAREGYHGWTMAADAVSTSAFDNPSALASRPEWVHLVDAPNDYRGPHRGAGAGAAYAAQVGRVAARLGDEGRPAAAFICEPVLGNAGGVMPPEGYLAAAYDAIRANGGLAIADEVQVGYGRLGGAFWGSELQGAVPDIIAVAKAAGNAYPVGAVIARREIVDALRDEGMFFSSAAGAPASAIAASAVLDVIRDEGLQRNAAIVGAHLRARIEELAARRSLIGRVHGSGLYLGVELVRDRETLEPAQEETARICERLLDHGIIMQATSERQNVLKVKPPMTLTIAEADVFVAALDAVLGELEG